MMPPENPSPVSALLSSHLPVPISLLPKIKQARAWLRLTPPVPNVGRLWSVSTGDESLQLQTHWRS